MIVKAGKKWMAGMFNSDLSIIEAVFRLICIFLSAIMIEMKEIGGMPTLLLSRALPS